MNINDLRRQIEQAGDIAELSDAFARLSEFVRQRQSPNECNTVGSQEATDCINRMRMVLAELEKQELRTKGPSRTMADRYCEIESAIRGLSDCLRESVRYRP